MGRLEDESIVLAKNQLLGFMRSAQISLRDVAKKIITGLLESVN